MLGLRCTSINGTPGPSSLLTSFGALAQVCNKISKVCFVRSCISCFCTTDWSITELKSTLQLVLRKTTHAVCVFIDGLDEVLPSDGALALLDTIEWLRCSAGESRQDSASIRLFACKIRTERTHVVMFRQKSRSMRPTLNCSPQMRKGHGPSIRRR